MVILRAGEEMTLRVKIAELDEGQPVLAALTTEEAEPETAALGMKLAVLTDELREHFDLDEEARGVVVTEVDPDSSAAERGIQPGDVILEVGLEEVASPADVLSKVEEANSAKRKSVLLLLDRGGDQRFVAVEINRS